MTALRKQSLDLEFMIEEAARMGRHFVAFAPKAAKRLWLGSDPIVMAGAARIVEQEAREIEANVKRMGVSASEAEAIASAWRGGVDRGMAELQGRAPH